MEKIRKTRARIMLDYMPPEIKARARVVPNSGAPFSRPEQIFNGVSCASGEIATFAGDVARGFTWRLDGSHMLPVTARDTEIEIGAVSLNLSTANGQFNSSHILWITIDFPEPINVPQVVVFTNDDAAIIRVEMFDAIRMARNEIVRRDADSNEPFVSSWGGENIIRARVGVTHTKTGLRHGQILEVMFGRMLILDDADIFSLSAISEADPLGGALPANSLRLRFANKGRFNHRPGDFADGLARRQLIEYQHGHDIDGKTIWRNCGVFHLERFAVNENDVEIVAIGAAHSLDNMTFYESALPTATWGQIINRVADNGGYRVAFPAPLGAAVRISPFFGNVSHRRALAMLAQLGCCMLTENRQGVWEMVDILNNTARDAREIGFDAMFAPPDISRGDYYNGITLREYTHTIQPPGRIATSRVQNSGTQSITVRFNRPYIDTGAISVSPGFSVSNVQWHTMYVVFNLTGNGQCDIDINGRAATFAHQDNFYRAPWMGANEREHGYFVDIPLMIANVDGHYPAFRNWFLGRKFELIRRRFRIRANWRQNPDLVIGDEIEMQTAHDGKSRIGHIIRQEINYDGGVLSGNTEIFG